MEFLLRHARVSTAPIAEVSETPLKLASYMISGDFLDCTPFNLLDIDGELVPIDAEWQSATDVSLGWVVTRGVLWSMPSGMSLGDASPSILELITALCDSFELAVSEPDIETWLEQEADFQRLVTGHPGEALTTGRTFRGMRPFLSEISSLKQTIAHREEQIARLNQTIAAREEDIAVREQDLADLRRMLGEREKEIASLTASLTASRDQMVAERDRSGHEAYQLKARAGSLNVELTKRTEQLNSVLQSPAWRLTAPLRAIGRLRPRSYYEGRQIKRDAQLIAQSGLFDIDWYLSQNPDVATHGADPIVHYLQHGALEGRDPSPAFSSAWYLEQNPDVRAAGLNPLVHYLRFGADEGRRPSPVA